MTFSLSQRAVSQSHTTLYPAERSVRRLQGGLWHDSRAAHPYPATRALGRRMQRPRSRTPPGRHPTDEAAAEGVLAAYLGDPDRAARLKAEGGVTTVPTTGRRERPGKDKWDALALFSSWGTDIGSHDPQSGKRSSSIGAAHPHSATCMGRWVRGMSRCRVWGASLEGRRRQALTCSAGCRPGGCAADRELAGSGGRVWVRSPSSGNPTRR
jgi:hypothetical protein